MNIIKRYKALRVSQKIHFVNQGKYNSPARIQNCHRVKTDSSCCVSLAKKEGAKRAHYCHFQKCGSVWACPVCGSIISERRCVELQNAFDVWRSFSPCNIVTMISYTAPHNRLQSLSEVLLIQDKAIRIMKNQNQRYPNKDNPLPYKTWKTIMDEMMSVGSYTGRDNTFGFSNGWHPHRHEVMFNIKATEDQLETWQIELTIAFSIAFVMAGGKIDNMSAFKKRAINFRQITDDQGFKHVSDYVTSIDGKDWTLAQEATKGSSKTASKGHITPFGMLEHIMECGPHSAAYSQLFFEYADTMRGKKMFWFSNGMKKLLNIHFMSEDEILKEAEKGYGYYNFNDEELKTINEFEIHGEVLALTEDRNDFEFIAVLDNFLKESRFGYKYTEEIQPNWLNEKQELKDQYDKINGKQKEVCYEN